jgi:pimeloyl-ACP methyl ester carboxylesterase
MGHSLTGHALLFWLGLDAAAPVDAAVTLGANIWLRACEPSPLRWAGKRAFIEGWRAATAVAGHFPARRLRLGTDDEAAEYVGDLCRYVREGRCRRRAGGDYLDALPAVRVPVLAVAGEADTWMCHPEAARRFHAPLPRHELRIVPGVDHMGLVLDSAKMRAAWAAIGAWVAGRP